LNAAAASVSRVWRSAGGACSATARVKTPLLYRAWRRIVWNAVSFAMTSGVMSSTVFRYHDAAPGKSFEF
jgi:hypothetical protein